MEHLGGRSRLFSFYLFTYLDVIIVDFSVWIVDSGDFLPNPLKSLPAFWRWHRRRRINFGIGVDPSATTEKHVRLAGHTGTGEKNSKYVQVTTCIAEKMVRPQKSVKTVASAKAVVTCTYIIAI